MRRRLGKAEERVCAQERCASSPFRADFLMRLRGVSRCTMSCSFDMMHDMDKGEANQTENEYRQPVLGRTRGGTMSCCERSCETPCRYISGLVHTVQCAHLPPSDLHSPGPPSHLETPIVEVVFWVWAHHAVIFAHL